MMNRLYSIAAVATALVSSPSLAVNIVANTGFETGDFTSWVVNNSSDLPWTVTGSGPVEGNFAASTGCVGVQCTDLSNPGIVASLYQNLATSAGAIYSLSFDFTPDAGTPNELKVLWGGTVVDDLLNVANTGTFAAYTVSGLTAGSSSTQLEFIARQDPGFDRLDNVSVQLTGSAVGAVPEPAAWLMMIVGFGAIGAAVRYRRTRAAVTYA